SICECLTVLNCETPPPRHFDLLSRTCCRLFYTLHSVKLSTTVKSHYYDSDVCLFWSISLNPFLEVVKHVIATEYAIVQIKIDNWLLSTLCDFKITYFLQNIIEHRKHFPLAIPRSLNVKKAHTLQNLQGSSLAKS